MAAFPFPIPDPPHQRKTQPTFAFPPRPVEPPVPAKEPLFRVPEWLPVPVEAILYFVVGTIVGALVMLSVATCTSLLRPQHVNAQMPAASAPLP